ncbi:hypothetical protein TNCV_4177111 [Trichonephila clavipes]|nr:hypothetical protein TNCV_4177111 [Trichonephila clavipes]
MERFLEQQYTIKFCVKLGKTGEETHDMIKEAYAVILPWVDRVSLSGTSCSEKVEKELKTTITLRPARLTKTSRE